MCSVYFKVIQQEQSKYFAYYFSPFQITWFIKKKFFCENEEIEVGFGRIILTMELIHVNIYDVSMDYVYLTSESNNFSEF